MRNPSLVIRQDIVVVNQLDFSIYGEKLMLHGREWVSAGKEAD